MDGLRELLNNPFIFAAIIFIIIIWAALLFVFFMLKSRNNDRIY